MRRDIIALLLDLSYDFRDINFHRASLVCFRLALEIRQRVRVLLVDDDYFRITAYLHTYYVDRAKYAIAKEVHNRCLKDLPQVDSLLYRDTISWRHGLSHMEDLRATKAVFEWINNFNQKINIKEKTEGPIRIKYTESTYLLLSSDKEGKNKGVEIIADLVQHLTEGPEKIHSRPQSDQRMISLIKNYCGNAIQIPDIFIERAQAYPVREFNVRMFDREVNLTAGLTWNKGKYGDIFPSSSPDKQPEAVEELKAIAKVLKAEFGKELLTIDPEKLEVQESLETADWELARVFIP